METLETKSETVRTVAPIHGSIVKAICKIQMSLEAVKKSTKNAHGGYMFASTDDIYAALTKKMGEAGLVLMSGETACEIVRVEKEGKTSQWLRATFCFTLATEEASWTDASAQRTLFIQVTGPQTFQAAQSYAEKAYMRSIFKLPTGDLDLDSLPQAETEEAQVALIQPAKRKSSSAAKKDGTDKVFNAIVADIRTAMNADMLRHIRTEVYAEDWASAPRAWVEILDNEYDDKMQSFGLQDAAE